MKAFLAFFSASAFCLAIVVPSNGGTGDVVLQKAPPLTIRQAPAYPENLARYHFGAAVKATPLKDSIASLQLSSNGTDRNTSTSRAKGRRAHHRQKLAEVPVKALPIKRGIDDS